MVVNYGNIVTQKLNIVYKFMEDGFVLVKEKLPEKGKYIIGIDEHGNKHYCFRCACHNPNCKEWRNSLTGSGLIVNIIKYIYE